MVGFAQALVPYEVSLTADDGLLPGNMLMVVVTGLDKPSPWPVDAARTDVLFVPEVLRFAARTVTIADVLAPGARATDVGFMTDGVTKSVEFESVAERVKVAERHDPTVSLFAMVTS